jgi:hypothetical protein
MVFQEGFTNSRQYAPPRANLGQLNPQQNTQTNLSLVTNRFPSRSWLHFAKSTHLSVRYFSSFSGDWRLAFWAVTYERSCASGCPRPRNGEAHIHQLEIYIYICSWHSYVYISNWIQLLMCYMNTSWLLLFARHLNCHVNRLVLRDINEGKIMTNQTQTNMVKSSRETGEERHMRPRPEWSCGLPDFIK